jgi:hypothetical protein
VRKAHPVKLGPYRGSDISITVPEAGNGRPAATVEIALAVSVDQIDTIPGNRPRIDLFRISVKYMAHRHILTKPQLALRQTRRKIKRPHKGGLLIDPK